MDHDSELAFRYRQRAEEVRTIADGTKDAKMRKILLGVAEDYDRMAKTMDRIAASEKARVQRGSP